MNSNSRVGQIPSTMEIDVRVNIGSKWDLGASVISAREDVPSRIFRENQMKYEGVIIAVATPRNVSMVFPDDRPPPKIIHSLQKPLSGGIPARLRAPIRKAKPVAGILDIRPLNLLISRVPVCRVIVPAHRKRRLLETAWLAICNRLPIIPRVVAVPNPNIM